MTETGTRQRVDQWLWHSRIVKTRSLAARMVEGGSLRINREKVTKPGHHIKPGDILTFMHANRLHVIEVLAIASRRGPAREAQMLYTSATSGACEQSSHGAQKGDA